MQHTKLGLSCSKAQLGGSTRCPRSADKAPVLLQVMLHQLPEDALCTILDKCDQLTIVAALSACRSLRELSLCPRSRLSWLLQRVSASVGNERQAGSLAEWLCRCVKLCEGGGLCSC